MILSRHIDWEGLEQSLSGLYVLENRRSSKPIQLVVSLHYLKYTYNLSDEEVVARWSANPYWQYFSGINTNFTPSFLPQNRSNLSK